jgi:pimeloyl-ACP methyl ester carboxylesterase
MEGKKHNGIFYRDVGSGPVLVLLHGFGEDSRIWNLQIEFLQNHNRLIIPDLRGTGRSAPDSINEISIESMAEDIKTILVHEQIETCSIIGHSMGGYIALAFAEKYPQNLKSLGLVHSTSYADSEEKKEARRKGISFIRENGAAAFIRATIPNLFATPFKDNQPAAFQQLLDWSEELSGETLIAYYESMICRPDRTPVLKSFKKPVLIIIGSEDKAVSPEDALDQATLPAQCQLCLLQQVAHMGMWEASETINRELLLFLEWTK